MKEFKLFEYILLCILFIHLLTHFEKEKWKLSYSYKRKLQVFGFYAQSKI